MDIIAKLKSIRAAFEAATQTFADYKVGEVTVRIEGDPIEGAAVSAMDADGNPIDPTGDHVIPVVGTITVENGVITKVVPAEVVEVVEAADVTDAAAAVEEVATVVETIAPDAPAEVVAAVSAEVVAEIMEKLEGMAAEIVEMKSKLAAGSEREKQMFEVLEQLAKSPTAPEKQKSTVGQFKKDNTDRAAVIAQTIQNLKNK